MNQNTQSPLAAPASPLAATPPPSNPAASVFAAPAQPGPAPAAAPAGDVGDTSYFDNVSSTEPLVQNCTVPGKIRLIEEKTSSSGNPFLNITVQLYGDKMTYADGSPCPAGKRLTTTLFLSAGDPEKFKRTSRSVKNLALALRNVPLDGKEGAAYLAWPAAQKLSVLQVPGSTAQVANIASLQPLSQWTDANIMVEVRKGKDMDGNARNEFNLLAASTKPVERKSR